MKRYLFASITLLAFVSNGRAQQQLPPAKMKRMMDSIKAVYIDAAALRNPLIRQAGVSIETMGAGRITSELNDARLLRGKLEATRLTAFFNVPVATIGRNILSANFAGRQQHMELYDVESRHPDYPMSNQKLDKYTIAGALTLTRIDSLFGRPAVFSGTAASLLDPETGQNRFTFTALAAVTLKKTKESTLSVGLLMLLDPMAPLPLIPFISYYRQINPRLELFADPSRIALRKELSPRHFLWFSNNIGGNLVMFELENEVIPRKSVYSTLELKTGLQYEYKLTRKVILGVSGGISTTATSKMLDQNKNRDPFIESKHKVVPYAQVSISCLPFWSGFVKP